MPKLLRYLKSERIGCSVDAWVSCGVNDSELDCLGGLWSGGRVNVDFSGRWPWVGMRCLDRHLGGVSPGWLSPGITRSWARKISAISSWGGSVVDNATVDETGDVIARRFSDVRKLQRRGLSTEWRDAGCVRCGYAWAATITCR